MAVPLTLDKVPEQTPYIQYVATNGQTVFPYPFVITQDSDLIVVANGVTLNTDSGYTLSGQGNDTGGNVTFTSGRTAGDIITLFRDIAIERLTQFGQNSGFSSTAFNAEFNNVYLILQQLEASIGQCLQVPNTNNPAPTTILAPGSYANNYLAFDGNGNPTPAALTSSGSVTGALVAQLLSSVTTNPPTADKVRTAAEISAGVAPVNYSYAPGNLLRYGADPTGQVDSTAAITAWLSVDANAAVGTTPANSLYAPAGTYLTSGGHTINATQGIRGDGIQRTIFQHTNASNILFSIPLYGSNQATVEFGGNRFTDFSCVGQGPSNTNEVGFYVKNKTDVTWDHVEVTGFGYGIQGARDNAANSCTDLSFIACRITNNNIGIYGPLQWNGTVIVGGTVQGANWSIILYDSQTVNIDTVASTAASAVGAIFLGGCQGCLIHTYSEGYASGGAMVVLADQQDVNGSATNNGIAIGRNRANKVHGGTYTSGTGVAYACKQIGGVGCSYEGIYAGSGIATGVVFLTTSTTQNFIGANYSAPGVNAVYQTAADQQNNFEFSTNTGSAHLGFIDTANLFLDEGNTSDTAEIAVNKIGYQQGTTHFRRFSIYDGKGALLMQTDGQTATINLSAATITMANIPTSNPGAGSKKVYSNSGVLTLA